MDRKDLEKQFTKKVRHSQGIVHKVCRLYCQDDDHRKDLFQEIMVQLWRSFPTFRGESQFSSWMYRVALNVAIQDLRKAKKKQQFFFQTNQFKDTSEEKKSEVQDEKLKLMHSAIAKLSKVEKAIVMLHLDEKSNEEIAEIVGITQNYVRVKMNRIRTKLSKTVKKK